MTVVCIINPKGGVGKTSSTIEIAAAAVHQTDRVLVIDLDGQGNSSSVLLGTDPRTDGIYNLLADDTGEALLARFIRPARESFKGVYCVPGDRRLGKIDSELINRVDRESILREAIAPLRARFGLILLDCPPALGVLTLNALVAADILISPCDTSGHSIEALAQLERTVALVKKRLNPSLNFRGAFVVRQEKANSNAFRASQQRRAGATSGPVLETSIPASTKVREAHDQGQSVQALFPSSPVARAYADLAKTLIQESPA